MSNELEQFILLDKNNFVERMTNPTDEDFALLDEALKQQNWPGLMISQWAMTTIEEAYLEEPIMDTACSILYKIVEEAEEPKGEFLEKMILGLTSVVKNKKYHYARFRAARILFLIGKNKKTHSMVNHADFCYSTSVLSEFSEDSEAGIQKLALKDLNNF